jgi:hypothetical protein
MIAILYRGRVIIKILGKAKAKLSLKRIRSVAFKIVNIYGTGEIQIN